MSYKIITRGNQDLSADFFNNGAYGDLFIIAGSEKVLKVFRRRENEYENFIASNTCRSEILAYEILRREPKLSLMAPNFYGRLELQQILEDEEDVSNRTSYIVRI